MIKDNPQHPMIVAHIDPLHCIGCTFCLKACPVDAIFGAAKKLHAVVQSGCTGCEQCVASCPTNCITMQPAIQPPITAEEELRRTAAKTARLAQGSVRKVHTTAQATLMDTSVTHLKTSLAAAIARGKAKRQS